MSGQGPKLVNKQFNSPINLYSPQSVKETLERQTQVLSNGAVGPKFAAGASAVSCHESISKMIAQKRIDFNQLAKPANLQNSAVLRMLEEEEARQRNGGQPSLKRVAWPPPPEEGQFDYVEQEPIQSKQRGVGEFASYGSSPISGPSPQPPPSSQFPHQGLVTVANQFPSSPSPSSPGGTLRQPSTFQTTAPKGWAPVTPPATSPLPNRYQQPPIWQSPPVQTPWQQPVTPQQQGQAPHHGVQVLPNQPHQHHQTPVSAFVPPPSTITLRPEPPISQRPAPVYQAQPAATMSTIHGNMRGDQKWPPESVKAQTEAENQARLELAKGPAVRPRLVKKDYSGFFAQHQLNSTYPGYRAPPGTQYFAPGYQH